MADGDFLDLRRHLPSATFVAIAALILAGLAGILIFAGVYNIGADVPHLKPFYWLLEAVRDRSIAIRARAITTPKDLRDPKRIAAGAGLYAEMCTGCHLAPGMEKTEMSQGLYPQAPEFAKRFDLSPPEAFWVVKHGIKLSAMPAWGRTHSDTLIWDMVAFLRVVPSLTPTEYQTIVKSTPQDHDEMMKDMAAMPGIDMRAKPRASNRLRHSVH
jgi:mono/diheme cytochrome c family protein